MKSYEYVEEGNKFSIYFDNKRLGFLIENEELADSVVTYLQVAYENGLRESNNVAKEHEDIMRRMSEILDVATKDVLETKKSINDYVFDNLAINNFGDIQDSQELYAAFVNLGEIEDMLNSTSLQLRKLVVVNK